MSSLNVLTSSLKQSKAWGDLDQFEELPTAVKSGYFESSPLINSYSPNRTPSRYGPKMDHTRNTLNSIIQDVVDKRETVNSAIERVKETNEEILRSMTGNEFFTTPKRPRKDHHNRKNSEFLDHSTQLYSHYRSPSRHESENHERTPKNNKNIHAEN